MGMILTMTSKLLFQKLKEFEGCRLKAYKDVAGVWTIGYGHTGDVVKGDRISQWWADELLRVDIANAERQVLKLGVCRTQGELDALVSFVYNLGIAALKTSTLYRLIRSGKANRARIKKEFGKWVWAGGQKMPGLIKRRAWEAERFFEATNELTKELD